MTNELAVSNPIVTIKNNAVVANSRDVAAYFGKHHHHVLDSIDDLIKQGVTTFREPPYVHEQNGQTYRSFDMTRDGFSLLTFKGSEAQSMTDLIRLHFDVAETGERLSELKWKFDEINEKPEGIEKYRALMKLVVVVDEVEGRLRDTAVKIKKHHTQVVRARRKAGVMRTSDQSKWLH